MIEELAKVLESEVPTSGLDPIPLPDDIAKTPGFDVKPPWQGESEPQVRWEPSPDFRPPWESDSEPPVLRDPDPDFKPPWKNDLEPEERQPSSNPILPLSGSGGDEPPDGPDFLRAISDTDISLKEKKPIKNPNGKPDAHYNKETGKMEVHIYRKDGSEVHLSFDRTGPQWNKEDGTLKPNNEYKTGEYDYTYKTDEKGRIISCEAEDLQKSKERMNENGKINRLPHNPITPGKERGDDAGHLIGDRFGGSPDTDNLVSQLSEVNKGEYLKMENEWAEAINKGEKVQIKIDVEYEGNSERPSAINVTYKIGDGDLQEIRYLNNVIKE